ncbi:MAG: hypothetical protein KIT22_16030, partial [Verrucomicrobiae bacterium]|nr:hypothetical protein [Verrucomicrobiae bacterium]
PVILQILPQAGADRIEIRPQSDGGLQLAPGTTNAFPISYMASTNLVRWTTVCGAINVEDGTLNVGAPNHATYYRMQVPDYSDRNAHIRIPPDTDLSQPQVLIIALHGDTHLENPGTLIEDELGVWLDAEGILSCFPSSTASNPAQWNGGVGARASDYAYLQNLILAAREQIPTIRWVQLMTFSQSGPTGVGLVLLRPDLVQSLVMFVGTDNTPVAAYTVARNGGLLKSPVKTVIVTFPDDGWYSGATAAAARLAKAQGFSGTPETLPDKLDILFDPAGLDTVVIKYGPNVELLRTSARSHDGAQYVSDEGGWPLLYVDLPKNGKMPSEPR